MYLNNEFTDEVSIDDFKRQLPSYLGFGILKPETIWQNDYQFEATYYFNETAVHTVALNRKGNKWKLSDSYQPRESRITTCATLVGAVQLHFLTMMADFNSAFEKIQQEVCLLNNVFCQNIFNNDNSLIQSSYPAGRMVILRLPIELDDNVSRIIDTLEYNIEIAEETGQSLLQQIDAYSTSYLITKRNGEKDACVVCMVEYIVPLALVYKSVKWLSDNKLINQKKMFQLMIQDSMDKDQITVQSFCGSENDYFETYNVLFKDSVTDSEKFVQFVDKEVDKFLDY